MIARVRPLTPVRGGRLACRTLALLLGLHGGTSFADPLAAPAPVDPASIASDRQAELDHLQVQMHLSDEAVARLEGDIGRLDGNAGTLRVELVDTARRIREAEDHVLAAEARLAGLAGDERRTTTSLAARRSLMVNVVAALQRMGHSPPPALLVRPDDALDAVRTAMLLGTLLPEMGSRVTALADDLQRLARLRQETATERDALKASLIGLAEDHARLDLLVGERQRAMDQDRQALAAERQRSALLARDATTLRDLLARLAAPVPAPPSDAARLAPAQPFEAARGTLVLPVSGPVRSRFGEPDGLGGQRRGMTLAARPGADVTSPCDGQIAYAGPFRSYGQLLIIDAGGGYHVLLAGLSRISVESGQSVLAGEPVGSMGEAILAVAGRAVPGKALQVRLDGGASGPDLYVEFRKDGTSVDPAAWWAPQAPQAGAQQGEKARG